MDRNFMGRITYEDLIEYTNDFSDVNCIGKFDFGKIYHGKLYWLSEYERPLTVKIWDVSDHNMLYNELRLMREITFLRNENIKCLPGVVKLCGYVMDGKHLASIYDFKVLGTLHDHLNQDDFTWVRRIKVALWFARLLSVFHRDPPYKPYIVQNIDPAHILLDEDYIPKLYDFSWMTGGGIFKRSPEVRVDASEEMTDELALKGDVFGYGLLLLSLISKEAIHWEAENSLLQYGWYWDWTLSQWDSDTLRIRNRASSDFSLAHESLKGDQYCASDGAIISRLVAQCLHFSPEQRPSMMQVVKCLEGLEVFEKNADLFEVKKKASSSMGVLRKHGLN